MTSPDILIAHVAAQVRVVDSMKTALVNNRDEWSELISRSNRGDEDHKRVEELNRTYNAMQYDYGAALRELRRLVTEVSNTLLRLQGYDEQVTHLTKPE